jgi:hypothetical protein
VREFDLQSLDDSVSFGSYLQKCRVSQSINSSKANELDATLTDKINLL